jgi:hypothetical protein
LKKKFHLVLSAAVAALNFDPASASSTLTKVQTLSQFAPAVPYKHKDEVIAVIDQAITTATNKHGSNPSQSQSAALRMLKTMKNDVSKVTGDSDEQSDTSHATNGAGAAIERGAQHHQSPR